MAELGTAKRPLRVAIIGSGPSGYYAADALLKSPHEVQVDIFDRLPTPYGLVRLGVAPDHQKIKNVIKVYERIAANSDCNFLGNVTVGTDISIEELREFYDAIIVACGAETDRRLNIPGEDLPGSHTATEFVAWYNGHPNYRDKTFDLSVDSAVVIGQGNVAVDVCRILAKTVGELEHTDIAQHALDALARSKIRNIHMIGRRGPVQAKFTQLEIKELGALADCDVVVDPADVEFDAISQAEYDDPSNQAAKRIVPILKEFSKRESANKSKRLYIHFCKSPAEIVGSDCVEKLVLERNELVGEPFRTKARGTGEFEEIECGLVFRSIGYRGVPLDGLPFDDVSGTIPNSKGRVLEDGEETMGTYVAGWIKRGPTGVIGTNKPDSQETVAMLLADIADLTPCSTPETEPLIGLLNNRGVRVVHYGDWQRIDEAEVLRGQPLKKPREKFTRIEEMLGILDES